MTLTADSVIVRNNDLPHTPLDSDMIVLNAASNAYVGLDDIGRQVWELLEQPCEVQSLVDRFVQEYAGSPEEIEADVMVLLDGLIKDGLVQIVAPQIP